MSVEKQPRKASPPYTSFLLTIPPPLVTSRSRGKLNREVQRVPLEDICARPALYGGITHLRWAVHNDWVSFELCCARAVEQGSSNLHSTG